MLIFAWLLLLVCLITGHSLIWMLWGKINLLFWFTVLRCYHLCDMCFTNVFCWKCLALIMLSCKKTCHFGINVQSFIIHVNSFKRITIKLTIYSYCLIMYAFHIKTWLWAICQEYVHGWRSVGCEPRLCWSLYRGSGHVLWQRIFITSMWLFMCTIWMDESENC